MEHKTVWRCSQNIVAFNQFGTYYENLINNRKMHEQVLNLYIHRGAYDGKNFYQTDPSGLYKNDADGNLILRDDANEVIKRYYNGILPQ